MPKTGDRCKCNKGRLSITKSVPSHDLRFQFQTLKCGACGAKESNVEKAENVRRRKEDYLIR
jgi:hypothetical protein